MTWANAVMLAASLAMVLLPWRLGGFPVRWVAALVLGVSGAVSLLEGWRWQLWPIFAFAALALAAFVISLRRSDAAKTLTPWRAAAAGLLVLLAVLAALPSIAFPIFDYPAPTGPLRVGVKDVLVQPQGKQASAPILVRAWYPTEAKRGVRFSRPEPEVALHARQISDVGMPGFLFRHLHLRRSHAFLNAPVSDVRANYPALLFDHGGEGNIAGSVDLFDELASHGFIVLSVSHPGISLGLVYPDGREVPVGERRYEEIWDILEGARATTRKHAIAKIRPGLQRTRVLNQLAWSRVRDVQQVLDAVESGADPLFRRVDRDQIGALGHSFGGATAALACHVDQRIRACANLDGFQFGGPLLEEPIRAPLLVVYGDHGTAFSDLFYRRADGTADVPVDFYLVRGAGHADLTDSAYWTPLKKVLNDAIMGEPAADGEIASRAAEIALFGPIRPERATAAVSAVVLHFFVKKGGFQLPAGELPRLPSEVIPYVPGAQWSDRKGTSPSPAPLAGDQPRARR